ncbi:MAG TPA: metallophosphoesterase [Archaeoglobaceae archaeon]|nr:metallophosphoesterase [Archaeoglobaceae archaeon]
MKILVIGDIHGKIVHSREEVDAVFIAGDFTNARDDSFAEEVLDILQGDIYAVPGNMDRKGVAEILDRKGVNIHLKVKKLGEISVSGYGGSNPTPFNTPFEIEDSVIAEHLSKMENVDVAIFHAPPFGYFDEVNGQHVGSRAIRDWILENKPAIAICAHIHEHQGVAKISDTILIKVGMASKGDVALVELRDEDIIVRFLRC